VKFIVEPQKQEKQEMPPPRITLCAKCSENPIFCNEF